MYRERYHNIIYIICIYMYNIYIYIYIYMHSIYIYIYIYNPHLGLINPSY